MVCWLFSHKAIAVENIFRGEVEGSVCQWPRCGTNNNLHSGLKDFNYLLLFANATKVFAVFLAYF